MNALLDHTAFRNDYPDINRQQTLAWLFFPFTLMALWFDSTHFSQLFFDGRTLTTAAALIYFAFMFKSAGSSLRILMFMMVIWSYIGELIFCTLLGWYDYRSGNIPLYVPFGHAIVYASGYIFSQTTFANHHRARLGKVFTIAFILLFALTGYFLNDPFTVAAGVLFFALLKRKRWQNLYFCIAVCVVYIELVGTWFECWAWAPKISGYIPTTNPPMGAVFFYAAGDVFLAKFGSIWEKHALINKSKS